MPHYSNPLELMQGLAGYRYYIHTYTQNLLSQCKLFQHKTTFKIKPILKYVALTESIYIDICNIQTIKQLGEKNSFNVILP